MSDVQKNTTGSNPILYSTKDLQERGLRPRTGETPAAIEKWQGVGRSGVRHLWRLDQTVEKVARSLIPATIEITPENVLRAVWSVNRAAKRRRDAASASYENAMHGFAGHHRREKEGYYRQKDTGIMWLAAAGHVTATHRHGGLVVWEGGGFSFHSTVAPLDADALPDNGSEPIRIEARPRGSREMRLVDATALIARLTVDMAQFARLAAPRIARKPRLDWECDDLPDYEDD